MLLPVAIVVVLILAAVAMKPKPASRPSHDRAHASAPPVEQERPRASIRQQMLDEEAAALSQSFRDAAHDQWMSEVAAKGVELLKVKEKASA